MVNPLLDSLVRSNSQLVDLKPEFLWHGKNQKSSLIVVNGQMGTAFAPRCCRRSLTGLLKSVLIPKKRVLLEAFRQTADVRSILYSRAEIQLFFALAVSSSVSVLQVYPPLHFHCKRLGQILLTRRRLAVLTHHCALTAQGIQNILVD